jgi:hypothetical protein
MGITPKQIGEMSLSQFNDMYVGYCKSQGVAEEEKAPSRKRTEQVYKELGVWYPEMWDEIATD